MRIVVVLLLLGLSAPVVVAKDGPADPPRTATAMAARIAELHRAGNATELKRLAALQHPDPWRVVAQLQRRAAHDAALAYAQATPSHSTEALTAYVEARRSDRATESAWAALESAMKDAAAEKPAAALARLPSPRPSTDTVLGIEMAHMAGQCHRAAERIPMALASTLEAAEGAEALGWRHRAGLGFAFVGHFQKKLGRLDKAALSLNRAYENWLAIEFWKGCGTVQLQMGEMEQGRNRPFDAIHHLERAVSLMEQAHAMTGMLSALQALGAACKAASDHRRAIEYYSRAARGWRLLKNGKFVSAAEISLGNIYSDIGSYAQAIRHYERGIEAAVAARHAVNEAKGSINLAGVNWRIGNLDRALTLTNHALKLLTDANQHGDAAHALMGLGILRRSLGDYAGSVDLLKRARRVAVAHGDGGLEAMTRANLAGSFRRLRDYPAAIREYEASRELSHQQGDLALEARCIGSIGECLIRQGKSAEGLPMVESCMREARSLRVRQLLIWSLSVLARSALDAQKPERAMFLAREARTVVSHVLGGLGVGDASSAREQYAAIYQTGALAASRSGDHVEALAFLESGRAGALLQLLGGRNPLDFSKIPSAARKAHHAARGAEVAARAAYQRAVKGPDRDAKREAAKILDAAQARVEEAFERLTRNAMASTGMVLYPRPETATRIQAQLKPDEALVLYGLGSGTSLAVIVSKTTVRSVELGPSSDVRAAAEAVIASDPEQDPSKASRAARKLLVDPLGLSKQTKRLLISPDSTLGYLPYALVFDRPVTLTPSGSTHALLRRERHVPGKGVLALGNPTYGGAAPAGGRVFARGGSLTPLPASGPEAKAVGDTVLLGDHANETELREALTKTKRWRAVHFACHGIIDRERPLLSALALTPSAEEDGFLTALEVIAMKIPADLAVLSACETGVGRVVGGEGIVGFTGAFIHAGAPRVLCSLWKVDDEATRTLMESFYGHWNPKPGTGLSAAAALRKAQEEVRAKPKWKHPSYWAGWVLWGLPD